MAENTKSEHYYYGLGRRKEAIASVRLYKGAGEMMVGNQTAAAYFNNETLISILVSPLLLAGQEGKMRAVLRVEGGGKHGQADAGKLAIARALQEMSADLRPSLKKAGMLTRDSREKERKKYGLKRARKAPQFSKR